jgi:hypothetical protein
MGHKLDKGWGSYGALGRGGGKAGGGAAWVTSCRPWAPPGSSLRAAPLNRCCEMALRAHSNGVAGGGMGVPRGVPNLCFGAGWRGRARGQAASGPRQAKHKSELIQQSWLELPERGRRGRMTSMKPRPGRPRSQGRFVASSKKCLSPSLFAEDGGGERPRKCFWR